MSSGCIDVVLATQFSISFCLNRVMNGTEMGTHFILIYPCQVVRVKWQVGIYHSVLTNRWEEGLDGLKVS